MAATSSPIGGHGGRDGGDPETEMSNAILPSPFLRRVWWADAVVSAIVGAAMAVAAAPRSSSC